MAPVIADNRSLGCNGVGVTTGAIRLAARSMSAPDSENSGELLGLWLSSADTGQWCHAALSQWLAARAHRGQHEHRNLAVRLGLVAGIVRPDRHGALPPDGLLVTEHLAGVVVAGHGAVLQLDPWVLHDVVVPDRIFGAPPSEATIAYWPSCSTRISGVLRSLPVFAPTVVSRMTGFPAAVCPRFRRTSYTCRLARATSRAGSAHIPLKAASHHLNGG